MSRRFQLSSAKADWWNPIWFFPLETHRTDKRQYWWWSRIMALQRSYSWSTSSHPFIRFIIVSTMIAVTQNEHTNVIKRMKRIKWILLRRNGISSMMATPEGIKKNAIFFNRNSEKSRIDSSFMAFVIKSKNSRIMLMTLDGNFAGITVDIIFEM